MTAFPDWKKHAVRQRHEHTGCIPTAFEMILRAAGAKGIDFDSFQEDFDLELHTTERLNNFASVAKAVHEKYPWVQFEEMSFATGAEKVAFIDDMLSRQLPVIASVSLLGFGETDENWHMYPIVDATDDEYTLLETVEDRSAIAVEIKKWKLAKIHDDFPGGKEVAFLSHLGQPPNDQGCAK